MRRERPDLFSAVEGGVPLSDADVTAHKGLRDLYREALIQMGFSEMGADSGMVGSVAYLRAAGGRGGDLGDGAPGSRAWVLTGGAGADSFSHAAAARLRARIREFMGKVVGARAAWLSGGGGAGGGAGARAAGGGGSSGGGGGRAAGLTPAGVVRESPLPDLRLAFSASWLSALFAPRRSLHPGFGGGLFGGLGAVVGPAGGRGGGLAAPGSDIALSSAAAVSAAAAAAGGADAAAPPPLAAHQGVYRLMVNVVRARNVPVRRGEGGSRGGGGGGDVVCPLVEAHFQGRAARGLPGYGASSTFHKMLALPLAAPGGGDASPARLAEVRDELVLHVFDEAVLEGAAGGDDRAESTTQIRRHRRWLGKVAIPFNSLLQAGGAVAGDFRLDTPACALGYRAPAVVNLGPSGAGGPGGAVAAEGGLLELAAGALGGGRAREGGARGGGSGGGAGVGLLASAESSRRCAHIYLSVALDPPFAGTLFGEGGEAEGEDGGGSGGGGGGGLSLALPLSRAAPGPQLREIQNTPLDTSAEGRALLEFAAAWGDGFSSGARAAAAPGGGAAAKRVCKAVVLDARGCPTLVTRFLSPVLPPPSPAHAYADLLHGGSGGGSSGGGGAPAAPAAPATAAGDGSPTAMPPTPDAVPRMATVDAAARFVALLPYLADAHAFSGLESGGRGLFAAGGGGGGGGGSASADTAVSLAARDYWCTVAETLEMSAGDGEEHALMLANYLAWFDERAGGGEWRTYIVLGRAHPLGETVWVLRQKATSFPPLNVFIDAVSGRSYLSGDDACPLTAVGMVANGAQAWANAQAWVDPWRMSWDFSDGRAWAPLLGGGGRPPLPPAAARTVQTAPLYRAPDVATAAGLEREISGALTAALRAWRPRFITRLRVDVAVALRPLLLELEARAAGSAGPAVLAAAEGLVSVAPGGLAELVGVGADGALLLPGGGGGGGGGGSSGGGARAGASGAGAGGLPRDLAAEHTALLAKVAARYTAYGAPLHCTFKQLQDVVEMVRATGLHRVEDESAQFAVAVAVVPYPCDVFSVWVYALTLLPQGSHA